jgi:superfamily II DNA or RNA helicase
MSLGDYILKAAAAEEAVEAKPAHGTGIPAMMEWFKPYPHQKKAIDRLFANKGKMILAHEMGTGKTAAAIYGFERLRHEGKAKRALVVVPSGLRANFAEGGIQKFTTSSVEVIGSHSEVSKKKGYIRPGNETGKDYTIVSYAQFRRDPEGIMQRTGSDTLILDEFHKTRNERASTFKAAIKARKYAVNFMGLTASMINNNPGEVATLLTISEKNREMSPTQFKRKFTKTIGFSEGFAGGKKKVKGFKNVEELKARTQPKIDYVETKDLKGKTMPRKQVSNVDVEMSPQQYQMYELALNRLGPLKERIVRRDPNISVKDAEFLFAQISAARQVSNSMHTARKDITPEQSAEVTPKVKRLLDDTDAHLKTRKDNKVVLYSNLIRGGVDVLSAGLKSRGVDHAVFAGKGTEIGGAKVTALTRQQGVRDFKAGKKRVIVLSGAGAEGLDLKNSTAFYALDGHFNPQRILQAEGRARRLGGQKHRKEENRVVDVRRYRSVVPEASKPGFIGRALGRKTPQTTDQWMYGVAGRKHKEQKRFYKHFKAPPKHIYKYRTASGEIRYVYPKKKKKPGFFSKLFSRKSSVPSPEQAGRVAATRIATSPQPTPVS